MGKVIVCLNEKGGVGKSATSQNLGKGLANIGKKILIIDDDPQGNTSRLLNGSPSLNDIDLNTIETEEDLVHCFLSNENSVCLEDLYDNPENVRKAILNTKTENLDILPCSLRLANTDTQLRMDITKAQHTRLKAIIKKVKSEYDYIIVDCPPVLNLLAVNALVAADTVIIPIKVDYAGLQGYSMTVQFIDDIKNGFDLDIDYKVMFTMVPKTSAGWQKSSNRIIELFKKIIPDKTLHTVIRNQSAPVVDSGFNSSFVIDNHKANIGLDYRNLVDEIENENI